MSDLKALCANHQFYGSFREMRKAADAMFEKEFVQQILTAYNGNISEAARAMKMDRKHLHDLCNKTRINPNKYRGKVYE